MVMEYYKADYGCQPVSVTKVQWLSRTAGWPGSHTGVTVTLSRSTVISSCVPHPEWAYYVRLLIRIRGRTM